MKRRYVAFGLAVLLPLRIGAHLPLADEPKAGPAIYNVFSEQDEQVLGKKAAEETDRTLPILNDPLLQAYIDQLGQKIAKQSRRPDIPYRFRIVNSLQINAFALPAGYVYVERGLLHVVENESELVGAMSHEVGHVVGRHGLANVSRMALVKMAADQAKKLGAGVIDEKMVDLVFDSVGGVAFVFANAKFTRDQESEADLFGAYNSVRSGWDPQGAVTLFQKFANMQKQKPDIVKRLLSSHPQPGDRAVVVAEEIQKMKLPPGLATNSLTFSAMKARLSLLGQPPPDPRNQKK